MGEPSQPLPVQRTGNGTTTLMVCDTGEPLPARLVQSLKAFSFVELHWFLPAALLPPSLRMHDLPPSHCHCCNPTQTKRTQKTVADIFTWTLCFNRYTVFLLPWDAPTDDGMRIPSFRPICISLVMAGAFMTEPSASKRPPDVPQIGPVWMQVFRTLRYLSAPQVLCLPVLLPLWA